jgi:hypothetical protein
MIHRSSDQIKPFYERLIEVVRLSMFAFWRQYLVLRCKHGRHKGDVVTGCAFAVARPVTHAAEPRVWPGAAPRAFCKDPRRKDSQHLLKIALDLQEKSRFDGG